MGKGGRGMQASSGKGRGVQALAMAAGSSGPVAKAAGSAGPAAGLAPACPTCGVHPALGPQPAGPYLPVAWWTAESMSWERLVDRDLRIPDLTGIPGTGPVPEDLRAAWKRVEAAVGTPLADKKKAKKLRKAANKAEREAAGMVHDDPEAAAMVQAQDDPVAAMDPGLTTTAAQQAASSGAANVQAITAAPRTPPKAPARAPAPSV